MIEKNITIQYGDIEIKKNKRTAQGIIIENGIKIFEGQIGGGHGHGKDTYKEFKEYLEKQGIISQLLGDKYYFILGK